MRKNGFISTVWMMGIALFLLLIWAGLSTLATFHYRSRLDGYRVELKDERIDGAELQKEIRETRVAFDQQVREMSALRSVTAELLNQLARSTNAPPDIRVVLDTIQRMGDPVFGKKLSDEETALVLQRLREMLDVRSNDVVQSVEWIRGLRLLAQKGFFPVSRAAEAADVVAREFYVRDTVRPAKAAPPRNTDPVPTTAGSPPAPEKTPPVRYSNDALRFSVAFPPDWVIKDKELPNAVLAQSPRVEEGSVDRGYAMVSGVRLQQDLLPEEYFRQRMDTLRQDNPGVVIIKEGTMPLAGGHAFFALSEIGTGTQTMKTLSLVAIRNECGYTLTFRSKSVWFANFEAAFLSIVRSFQVQ